MMIIIARIVAAVVGAVRVAKALLALAVVAALTTAWVWRYQAGKTAGKADIQALWDADKLIRSAAALETIKGFVAERSAQQQEIDRANQALRNFEAIHVRYVAAAAADLQRLRGDIAAFTSGGGDAAADSVAACRARADTVGSLLGEALRTAGECAANGELDAATARAVLKAWPVSQSSSQ